MTFDYTFTVEAGHREVEITVEVEYSAGHNGIGAYEYWGQRCYDKGEVEIEIEETNFTYASWVDTGEEVKCKNAAGWLKFVNRAIDGEEDRIIKAIAND